MNGTGRPVIIYETRSYERDNDLGPGLGARVALGCVHLIRQARQKAVDRAGLAGG